jgi:hypothetical protein
MRPQTFVTVLLILASVLMALGLFVAGAMWKGRSHAHSAPESHMEMDVNRLANSTGGGIGSVLPQP